MSRSAAAKKLPEGDTLRERVEMLQTELAAALMELAIEQRAKCQRQGPEGGIAPPVEVFHRGLLCERDGSGQDSFSTPCKCFAYLLAAKE